MATGDRVVSTWQEQHELIEAAQEQGWTVVRYDIRAGITLEEPNPRGVVMTLHGQGLSPAFIRSLPEAREALVGEEVRYSRADPNR